MYKEDFSFRLAFLRNRMNISARDMSLSLGQNPGYINNIESGKALPSMSMFFYICEYLGISPAEFFDTENDSPIKTKKFMENLFQLDEESLNAVSVIVERLSKK
ncbi:MAG: helix-turn-helix transcriptional regulator [Ruminococcaceae bacterium]|nr:helix-turn-helix transcriptional regulator [Oscillospiraceae bacterium]